MQGFKKTIGHIGKLRRVISVFLAFLLALSLISTPALAENGVPGGVMEAAVTNQSGDIDADGDQTTVFDPDTETQDENEIIRETQDNDNESTEKTQDADGIADAFASVLPVDASDIEVKISYTNGNAYSYGFAPQEITVGANAAEDLGYTDNVTDSVSLLDAVAAMHKIVYTDEETIKANFTLTGTSVSKMMGVEGINKIFVVNGILGRTTVPDTPIADGDIIELFDLIADEYAMDNYAWFEQDGEKVTEIAAKSGEDIPLTFQGISAFGFGDYGAFDEAPIEDADIVTFLIEEKSGYKTAAIDQPLEIATDEDGEFNLNFETAGTYYVTAVGTDGYESTIMLPWLEVAVEEKKTQVVFESNDTEAFAELYDKNAFGIQDIAAADKPDDYKFDLEWKETGYSANGATAVRPDYYFRIQNINTNAIPQGLSYVTIEYGGETGYVPLADTNVGTARTYIPEFLETADGKSTGISYTRNGAGYTYFYLNGIPLAGDVTFRFVYKGGAELHAVSSDETMGTAAALAGENGNVLLNAVTAHSGAVSHWESASAEDGAFTKIDGSDEKRIFLVESTSDTWFKAVYEEQDYFMLNIASDHYPDLLKELFNGNGMNISASNNVREEQDTLSYKLYKGIVYANTLTVSNIPATGLESFSVQTGSGDDKVAVLSGMTFVEMTPSSAYVPVTKNGDELIGVSYQYYSNTLRLRFDSLSPEEDITYLFKYTEGYNITTARDKAKTELDSYKNRTDYTPENWDEITALVATWKGTIDTKTSIADIESALTNAKAAMDAIAVITDAADNGVPEIVYKSNNAKKFDALYATNDYFATPNTRQKPPNKRATVEFIQYRYVINGVSANGPNSYTPILMNAFPENLSYIMIEYEGEKAYVSMDTLKNMPSNAVNVDLDIGPVPISSVDNSFYYGRTPFGTRQPSIFINNFAPESDINFTFVFADENDPAHAVSSSYELGTASANLGDSGKVLLFAGIKYAGTATFSHWESAPSENGTYKKIEGSDGQSGFMADHAAETWYKAVFTEQEYVTLRFESNDEERFHAFFDSDSFDITADQNFVKAAGKYEYKLYKNIGAGYSKYIKLIGPPALELLSYTVASGSGETFSENIWTQAPANSTRISAGSFVRLQRNISGSGDDRQLIFTLNNLKPVEDWTITFNYEDPAFDLAGEKTKAKTEINTYKDPESEAGYGVYQKAKIKRLIAECEAGIDAAKNRDLISLRLAESKALLDLILSPSESLAAAEANATGDIILRTNDLEKFDRMFNDDSFTTSWGKNTDSYRVPVSMRNATMYTVNGRNYSGLSVAKITKSGDTAAYDGLKAVGVNFQGEEAYVPIEALGTDKFLGTVQFYPTGITGSGGGKGVRAQIAANGALEIFFNSLQLTSQTGDITFTFYFEDGAVPEYSATAATSNDEAGSAELYRGGPEANDYVAVAQVSNLGYYFDHWEQGAGANADGGPWYDIPGSDGMNNVLVSPFRDGNIARVIFSEHDTFTLKLDSNNMTAFKSMFDANGSVTVKAVSGGAHELGKPDGSYAYHVYSNMTYTGSITIPDWAETQLSSLTFNIGNELTTLSIAALTNTPANTPTYVPDTTNRVSCSITANGSLAVNFTAYTFLEDLTVLFGYAVDASDSFTAAALSADENFGAVNVPLLTEKNIYVLLAKPKDGYILENWQSRPAGNTDEAAWVTVSGSYLQTSYTATLTENTEFRAVFVSSADRVDMISSTASVRKMDYDLEADSLAELEEPASGSSGMLSDRPAGNYRVLTGFRSLGNSYQIPVSEAVNAYDGVILTVHAISYNTIAGDITAVWYAGDNTSGAVIYTETAGFPNPQNGTKGGNIEITASVDSIPVTENVTIKLTWTGGGGEQKEMLATVPLAEALTVPEHVDEHAAAASDISREYKGIMAVLAAGSPLYQYSSKYLMTNYERDEGFNALSEAATPEEITKAKNQAIQFMKDAATGLFHHGVQIGSRVAGNRVVSTIPIRMPVQVGITAALEDTYPGRWSFVYTLSQFGAYARAVRVFGPGYDYPGHYGNEENGDTHGIGTGGVATYSVGGYAGISHGMANGVSSQRTWFGITQSMSGPLAGGSGPDARMHILNASYGTVSWDLALLRQRYSDAELLADEVYLNALENQFDRAISAGYIGRGSNAYAFSGLDPEDPEDLSKLEAYNALRLKYLDFLYVRETRATRDMVLMIDALTEESNPGAARTAYDKLTEREKAAVFNYYELVALEAAKPEGDGLLAYNVDQKIDAIGTVAYTAESSAKITDARKAYDSATYAVKALVEKFETLTAAETAFAKLKDTAVDAVKSQISSLKSAETMTLADEAAVTAARTAFEALLQAERDAFDDAHKAKLEAAESRITALIAEQAGNYETQLARVLGYLRNTVSAPDYGNEWPVLALARGGYESTEYYDSYYGNIMAYVSGKTKLTSPTDNARVALAVTALGADAANVNGTDLVAPLTDMTWIESQGLNAAVYTLLAVDAKPYAVTDKVRGDLKQYILNKQFTGGGWAWWAGGLAEPDITGMAIQALAPYANEAAVKTAIDSALTAMDGVTMTSAESCAQMIIALSALNRDAGEYVTALLAYYDSDSGGFINYLTNKVDAMSSEQAACALAAYDRYKKEAITLYDMSDAKQLISDGLLPAVIDKDALNAKIAEAEAIVNNNYTQASWGALQVAISNAKAVSLNDSVTQAQVNSALTALSEAIGKLAEYDDDPATERRYAWISVTDPGATGNQKSVYFPLEQFEISEDETAFSLLQRAAQKAGLKIETTGSSQYAGVYVASIDGFGEFSDGVTSGWMYKVDGAFPESSSSLYLLEEGMKVEWVYTRSLGNDVGGSSGSGGSSIVSDRPTTAVIPGGSGNLVGLGSVAGIRTTVAATVSGNNAVANVDSETVEALLEAALAERRNAEAGALRELIINVTGLGNATSLKANFNAYDIETVAREENIALTVQSPAGTVTLDNAALKDLLDETSSGSATISIAVNKPELQTAERDIIGNSPVFDLIVTVGSHVIHDFKGTATVLLPYEPEPGEDTNQLAVWHLAENGGITEMDDSRYVSGRDGFLFTTDHFSLFFIAEAVNADVAEADDESAGQETAWENPYPDVTEADWFYTAVRYAAENKLMNGMDGGLFSPDTNLSRAQTVTILFNGEGNPSVSGGATFGDVKEGDWYYGAVAWASKNGIAQGYGGLFGSDDSITREQLVTMLYSYAKLKGYDLSKTADLTRYTDLDEVSGYAKEPMSWASANGIINGRTLTTLVPQGTATRAEAAALIMNFTEAFK